MPPRSALHRVATALLALLYFVAWGEPVSLHPCPMHDGAGVAVVRAGAHPHAGATGAAAPAHQHAHQHAAVAADGGSPDDGHDGHQCRCLGHGCCTAAAAAPAGQRVRWFVAVTRRADPPASTAHAEPRAPAPRLLPPATGPPALG
jgi:hypothetical protein